MFMVPRAKVYKRETLEDADGVVHYLCEKRWIEITPASPRCELGKSKTLTTSDLSGATASQLQGLNNGLYSFSAHLIGLSLAYTF